MTMAARNMNSFVHLMPSPYMNCLGGTVIPEFIDKVDVIVILDATT